MTGVRIVLVNLEAAYMPLPPVVLHATAVIVGSGHKAPVVGHPSYAPVLVVLGAIAVGYLIQLAARFFKTRQQTSPTARRPR
jgi:hypothetical protein